MKVLFTPLQTVNNEDATLFSFPSIFSLFFNFHHSSLPRKTSDRNCISKDCSTPKLTGAWVLFPRILVQPEVRAVLAQFIQATLSSIHLALETL